MKGQRTVHDVIQEIGDRRDADLRAMFRNAGVPYPPDQITFIAFKDTKALEIWAQHNSEWVFIDSLEILATSGLPGPKLREGDRQVPEGIYRIIGLNPNSAFHLSMKLNYPNEFDLKWAKLEGRSEPGTNIFIHGKSQSIGCLAMGDPAIERLFVLVERVGPANTSVIIAPTDPRKKSLTPPSDSANWVSSLYAQIESEIIKVAGS